MPVGKHSGDTYGNGESISLETARQLGLKHKGQLLGKVS